MAGRGPAPSGRRSRARDEKLSAPVVEVVADEQLRGPDLPESVDWPAATVAWWDTWRSSPLTQTWTPTDWDFLLDTAVLHAEFWSGNLSVAAELRLRVAKFGATPEDRARLKVSIKTPDAPAASTSTPATRKANAARRSRVLRVVDGETG